MDSFLCSKAFFLCPVPPSIYNKHKVMLAGRPSQKSLCGNGPFPGKPSSCMPDLEWELLSNTSGQKSWSTMRTHAVCFHYHGIFRLSERKRYSTHAINTYMKTCSFRTGGKFSCLQSTARWRTLSSNLRKLAGMGCSNNLVLEDPARERKKTRITACSSGAYRKGHYLISLLFHNSLSLSLSPPPPSVQCTFGISW